MKKLSVKVPLVGKVSMYALDLSSSSKILSYLNQKLLYVYIVLLPFLVFLLKDETLETSVFFGSLFLIVPLISVFLIRMVLIGSNVFTDPKGFIVVLVFALLTTTASISIDSPTTTNTFGQDAIRGLSGIMIMGFIALYYSINVAIKDKNAFKRYILAFLIGTLLFGYIALFQTFRFEYGLILLSSIPFLFAFANSYPKLKFYLYTFILILLSVLIFGSKMFTKEVSLFPYEILILISLLSFLIITYILLANSTQKLKRKDNWFNRILPLNSESSIVINSNMLLNSIPMVFFAAISLYFFYSLFDTNSFNDFLKATLENYSDGFKYITDERFEGFDLVQNLAFGVGSDAVSEDVSLFSSVLVSQGIFGVVAYLALYIYAIINAVKLVVNSYLKNTYFHLSATLLFNILVVSLLSIFIYPGLYLLSLWWISFSMLMAYDAFKSSKEDKLYFEKEIKIYDSKQNSNYTKYAKFISTLLIFVLATALIYQLVISIGEV